MIVALAWVYLTLAALAFLLWAYQRGFDPDHVRGLRRVRMEACMTHAPIETVEISMNEDGTYLLQRVRIIGYDGRSLLQTVIAESIPAGLRALAGEMEREGRAEFFGRTAH